MLDAAARRDQSGSVLVLAGTGLQARDLVSVPSAHLFHIVMALRNSGLEFAARMVAAEALART
jgi:predicted aconitase